MQSARERLAEIGQPGRPDRGAKAGRTPAPGWALGGLPWRERPAPAEGVVAPLSDDHPGFDAGDESAEGTVPMACAGRQVYAPRQRAEWLSQIAEAGVRCRAEFTYQPLDGLQALRPGVRRDLLVESGKHQATELRRQIPGLGPIRAGLLVAILQTPDRFRTQRPLWAYRGLAIERPGSGEYRYLEGSTA